MPDPDPSALLLTWYDSHARVLPWRVPPGSNRPADPYRIWLSEVMLQQTTVAAVKDYFNRFTTLWPDVQALAAAQDALVMAEWAGLGYYARARNLLKCAREVSALGGFPDTVEGLRALPGIGPYTAAAIAAIAFDAPAAVIDGNVERVLSRLFNIQTPLPQSRPQIARHAADLTPQIRPGDHAQAMMDLGATICTPRNPACAICPLMGNCAGRLAGTATELPRKQPKPEKPTRQGRVWLIQRGADWLLETRPPKGLLGGMLAFPGDGWDGSSAEPPLDLTFQPLGTVRHTFTHFHLHLTVLLAQAPANADPLRGQFLPASAVNLPTLMRKALDLAILPR